MKILQAVLFMIFLAAVFPACVSSKKLTQEAAYFTNISDSILQKSGTNFEPVFQKGDILSIGVLTSNEKSARLFNQPGYYSSQESLAGTGSSSSGSGSGYLVDETGTISFPYLGKVAVAGLTRAQLTDSLQKSLQKFIDSSIVTIRLLNYRVTILGEVMRPGAFYIPSERVSILDAIGLAGDLTIYGKRNNIRVIRTADGWRQTGTIDLNKGDVFNSPYFYLRQNDIVYVELNDRKIPNTDQASIKNVSIGLGIISAIGVIISTINVLRR
jgi:polysaccharide export outer membrane protein